MENAKFTVSFKKIKLEILSANVKEQVLLLKEANAKVY